MKDNKEKILIVAALLVAIIGLLTVGNFAFDSNHIINLVIPNSVTTIGYYSFGIGTEVANLDDTLYGSNSLTSVIIHNTPSNVSFDNSFGWASGKSDTNIQWLG